MTEKPFLPLQLAVLTISDSRTAANDTSGDLLQRRAEAAGHKVTERMILPDDRYVLRAQISQWFVSENVDVIVTTGGTGLTGRDGTPEAVLPLLDKVIEGFGEMFRMISWDDIGTSTLQSRALAGVANGKYIFCVPGSNNACATAWDKIIEAQLDSRTKPCNLPMLIERLKES